MCITLTRVALLDNVLFLLLGPPAVCIYCATGELQAHEAERSR